MVSTHKKYQFILGTIVAILGFSLYANTIKHNFVLDDYFVIKENSIVKRGLTGIPSLLQTDYQYGYGHTSNKFYRPLSLIMFAIEWQISPNNPTLHHFIHVLLYALTGFILFYTLSDLLRGYNLILPFVVSLLFISHPIHTEVVANIKSRDLMMAFFFVILTFHLLQKYLQNHNFIFLIVSLICYFLSLFCKESTITILAIIPILIHCFTNAELRHNCLISTLFVIPIGVYLILRDMILGTGSIDSSTVSIIGVLAVVPVLMSIFFISIHRSVLITLSFLLMMAVGYLLWQMKTTIPDYVDRMPVAIEIMGIYLLKLFYPHPLVFDASYNQYPYISWNSLKAIIPLLAYSGLGILAITNIKRKNIVAFGIFYFIISMSIHIYSMFNMDLPYGERFLYISSFGFTLVVGFVLVSLLKIDLQYVSFAKISEMFKSNITLLSITLVIITLYSYKTITRNIDWQTNTTLRTADVHKSPNSARMRYYYGLTLMEDRAVNATTENARKNYLHQAINEFLTATAINENMREPYSQLGIAYFRLGDYHKALEYYKKARFNADVANNMGILYYKTGDYEKALSLFQMATQLNPNLANTYFNMGIIQGSIGNYQQAIEHLKDSIKRDAYHAPTYYHLGLIYQKNRDEKNARIQFSKAYQLDPRLLK